MRRKVLTMAAVLGAASLIGAAPAHTQTSPIVDRIHADSMVQIMQAVGVSAEIVQIDGLVRIAGLTKHGVRFVVDGFNCQEDKACETIRFQAGWVDMDPAQGRSITDAYDRQYVYGRAFLDANDNPIVQHFATAGGGVTVEHLALEVMTWTEYVVPEFLALLQGAGPVSENSDGGDAAPAAVSLSENSTMSLAEAESFKAAKPHIANYRTVSAQYSEIPPTANAPEALPDFMNRLEGPPSEPEAAPDLGNWLNQY